MTGSHSLARTTNGLRPGVSLTHLTPTGNGPFSLPLVGAIGPISPSLRARKRNEQPKTASKPVIPSAGKRPSAKLQAKGKGEEKEEDSVHAELNDERKSLLEIVLWHHNYYGC